MNNKVKFLRGTSSEYSAVEKDSDTIYFTTDNRKLYIGDKEISSSDVTIDNILSDTSENPVQNKIVKQAIDNKADKTVATTSTDGLMSAEDKSKLDSANDTYALKSKYGNTTINVGRKTGTAIGSFSNAEGRMTTASGECSHAEGIETTTSGEGSHAEGRETTASGKYSHTEGVNTVAIGHGSHAEGSNIIKVDDNGYIVFGGGRDVVIDDTTTINVKGSQAYGINSHAEGCLTLAYGVNSHAEGYATVAYSNESHAEGSGSKAMGTYSHAEGYMTNASGACSHTGGSYTKALHNAEVAYGKFNKSNDDTLFSIGDGTGENTRHNAFEITTTGGKLHDKDIATTEQITTHTDNSNIHVTTADKSNWNGYATEIEQNKTDISTINNQIALTSKMIFSFNLQRTGKVYTVKFPLWETSQTCDGEKLDDNAGLVCNPSTAVTRGVSDYDDIPLFRTYDCNAYVDDNGVRHITALKGDSNFKDVGKVDVFVLGMSYYEKWWQADGYVYYSRTDIAKEGYTLAAECRTKDGADQGFALYGKYMAGDIDGKPYGSKGLVPARYCSGRSAGSQNISYSGNITYFGQRGAHYSGTFMSEIKYITTSWWLKYGTRNSQSVMAGCTNYSAQYAATVEETGVKRIIISNANAAYFEVGMPVSVGTSTNRNEWACHNKAESATITAIEVYDDSNKAIYVDVDTAFDTTTSTYITTFHWRSGFSDNVLGRDGCSCPTSAGLTNGKYPVVIQGIECFVGMYEVGSNAAMDIVDSTGKRDVYITNDSTKLTTNIDTIKSIYTKIAEQIVPAPVNARNYITAVGCNVGSGVIVPTAAGQSGSSSATGYADGLYCDSASSGQRECLCFGALGDGARSGVSCLRAASSLGNAGWSLGARLSING